MILLQCVGMIRTYQPRAARSRQKQPGAARSSQEHLPHQKTAHGAPRGAPRGALPRSTPAEHSRGALPWGTPAEHSRGALPQSTPMGHSRGALARSTPMSWGTPAEHSHGALSTTPAHRGLVGFCFLKKTSQLNQAVLCTCHTKDCPRSTPRSTPAEHTRVVSEWSEWFLSGLSGF